MFIARRMPVRLLVGGVATALIAATCLSFPTAPAAEGIDEIITGALDKAPVLTPTPQPLPAPVSSTASDAFGATLQLVVDGKYADAYDAAQNIQGGVQYLSWLLKRYGGDLKLAAAGYNAGEGAVDKYRGVPPYSETRRYVERVATLADRYRGTLAER